MARTRMTLLNYLRSKLNVYPDNGCVAVTQDGGGNIYYWKSTPVFRSNLDEWVSTKGTGHTSDDLVDNDYYMADARGDALENPVCTDYKTAIITADMFVDVLPVAAANFPQYAVVDLVAVRDRIIEIHELQRQLSAELSGLHVSIGQAGFKLDLNAMKK